jgi:hypothetical protein
MGENYTQKSIEARSIKHKKHLKNLQFNQSRSAFIIRILLEGGIFKKNKNLYFGIKK